MERLTKDFSELGNGKEYTPCISCDSRGLCNYCDYPEKAVAGDCYLMDIYNRLAAYEDTGLTLEEVEYTKLALMGKAIAEINEFDGLPVDRLKELAAADKEDRVVVLPCKVGDTVWVTGRDKVAREMTLEPPDIRTVCTDEDNLCMALCNRRPDGFCAYRLRNDGSDMNKTVFLTRNEAEEALRRADNG